MVSTCNAHSKIETAVADVLVFIAYTHGFGGVCGSCNESFFLAELSFLKLLELTAPVIGVAPAFLKRFLLHLHQIHVQQEYDAANVQIHIESLE